MSIFKQLVAISAFEAIAGLAAAQSPVTSAFTYQGQLRDGGLPASGTYGVSVTLWDSPVGGVQIGVADVEAGVPIADGLLAVQLNDAGQFGPNAFTGEARWIEISVNGTPLAPRQPLTATPFAIHALGGAGSPEWAASGSMIYNTNSGDVGIGTQGPLAKLHVSRADIALTPGALHSDAMIINGGDGVLGIYSDAAGGAGNGSAIALGEIGTGLTDKWGFFRDTSASGSDLHVSYGTDPDYARNPSLMVFDAATRGIGIGADSPTARLHVAGGRGYFADGIDIGVQTGSPYKLAVINQTEHAIFGKVEADGGSFAYGVYGQSDSESGGGGVFGIAPIYGVRGLAVGTTGTARGGEFTSNSTGGEGVVGYASASSGLNYGVRGRTDSPTGFAGYFEGRGYFSGSLGLGTTSPAFRAHILDSTSLDELLHVRNDGIGRTAFFETIGTGTVPSVTCFKTGGTALRVYSTFSSATTLATDVPLAVGGGSDSSLAGGGFVVFGNTAGANLSIDNNEIMARNNGAASPVYINHDGGNVLMTAGGEGNVGIGTIDPFHGKLDVDGGNYQAIAAHTNSSTWPAFVAFNEGTAPAGWFEGNVVVFGNTTVNGNLSKSSGSFRIDHPLDPANKYLFHSFVESPDMKNLYDGIVITDERGYATIEMPDWFEALNRDFRYQLTVIDEVDSEEFVQAKVVRGITDRKFSIRTSRGGVTVSWQVTGTRQDPWAEAHRIPVEQEKSERERGKFQHPELYGQPREMGLNDHVPVDVSALQAFERAGTN